MRPLAMLVTGLRCSNGTRGRCIA